MTDTHRYERSLAAPAELDGDGRPVTVRLVQWNAPAAVVDPHTGRQYREQFAPGSIVAAPGTLLAVNGHRGPLVGRIRSIDNRTDGAYATVRLVDTTDGRDMRTLLTPDDGDVDGVPVIDGVSMEFDAVEDPAEHRGGLVTRARAWLTGLAFTPFPQHTGGRVLAIRSHQEQPMTTPDTATPQTDPEPTTTPPAAPATTTTAAPPAQAPAQTPPPAAVSHEREVPRPGVPAPGAATAGRFRSFGEYTLAAWQGRLEDPEAHGYQRAFAQAATEPGSGHYVRALADLVTGDMPSVVRDAWIPEVIDLVRTLTPTLNAWAQRPLPSTGLTIAQPVVDTRPTVAVQTTEKTDITSTDITLDVATWPVRTYAGGNDIAIQLLERADIDVLNEFMRLYAQAMARTLNSAAAGSLLTSAALVNTPIEYTTAAEFDTKVIDGQAELLAALGQLGNVLEISVDLWKALAGLKDSAGRPLYPSLSPMNPIGSLSITTTDGQVRDLDYVVEPAFTGITAVLGVREAFVTRRSGIRTMTADVPTKLGRDHAVYEYASFGAIDAAGLVLIENATP